MAVNVNIPENFPDLLNRAKELVPQVEDLLEQKKAIYSRIRDNSIALDFHRLEARKIDLAYGEVRRQFAAVEDALQYSITEGKAAAIHPFHVSAHANIQELHILITNDLNAVAVVDDNMEALLGEMNSVLIQLDFLENLHVDSVDDAFFLFKHSFVLFTTPETLEFRSQFRDVARGNGVRQSIIGFVPYIHNPAAGLEDGSDTGSVLVGPDAPPPDDV